MNARLLLVTPRADDHGNAVERALLERGFENFARLDLDADLPKLELSYHQLPDGAPRWVIDHLGGPCPQVDSRSLDSVWFRRWSHPNQAEAESQGTVGTPSGPGADDAHDLCAALELFIGSLPAKSFPLGSPASHLNGEHKPRQLEMARRLGLRVPSTLYSNSKAQLLEFIHVHERVVVKPLVRHQWRTPQGTQEPLRANSYERSFLTEILEDHDGTLQLLVQESIPKVADLRVTMIPGATWCCEIDTSGLDPSTPDWRSWHDQFPHRMIETPAPLEKKLRAYLQEAGLAAGYFDLARTPEGDFVFFECNTNAEWLWVERLTGAPIAASVADALLAQLPC